MYSLKIKVPYFLKDNVESYLEQFSNLALTVCEDESGPMSEHAKDAQGFPIAENFDVTILTDYPMDENKIAADLEILASLHNLKKFPLIVEKLENTDWLEKSYHSFPPQDLGKFYIINSHHDAKPDRINLSVHAATAFGSGEHPTTKGCLLAIQDLANVFLQNNIDCRALECLDLGCGSGILAIAMAKIWHTKVEAIDCDEEAVKVTNYNVNNNGCNELIKVSLNSQAPDAKYDVIVANILSKTLLDLSTHLVKALKNNGYLILSGLLQSQAAEVLKTYEKIGLKLYQAYTIDDWQTLVLSNLPS